MMAMCRTHFGSACGLLATPAVLPTPPGELGPSPVGHSTADQHGVHCIIALAACISHPKCHHSNVLAVRQNTTLAL